MKLFGQVSAAAVSAVAAMERSPEALGEAQRAFVDARRLDRAFNTGRAAAYVKAAALLERGGH